MSPAGIVGCCALDLLKVGTRQWVSLPQLNMRGSVDGEGEKKE